MGMRYKHITKDERIKIETLKKEGYSQTDIANHLKRNRSTISREFGRNYIADTITYKALVAEKRRKQVRTEANQAHRKLVEGNRLEGQIEVLLKAYLSPEQITGILARRARGKRVLCHETIYHYLYTTQPDWIEYLRHGHKRRYRRRRGTAQREKQREQKKKRFIDERPAIVEKRTRLGDWEGDTIVGKEKTERILTYVERKSGYLLACKLSASEGPLAQVVAKKTIQMFSKLPKRLRKTLTYDNGTEFAEHERIERDSRLTIYFAHPYHSWERGTNENTNGLVRQFFPKGSPFKGISDKEVRQRVRLINKRPRKRHNYRTPQNVLRRRVAV